jgi:hypothetical protein
MSEFISANVTPNLPYVDSITVRLNQYEVDTVITALNAYDNGDSGYYQPHKDLANAFQRYVSEGMYSDQLDRIMNSGVLDHYLHDGKMIPPCKYLRLITECSLGAAKHAVDRRKQALNI